MTSYRLHACVLAHTISLAKCARSLYPARLAILRMLSASSAGGAGHVAMRVTTVRMMKSHLGSL